MPIQSVDEVQEMAETNERLISMWRQCSGLGTVSDWVRNYRKHPGCWAALTMIHGAAEVTGRLRSKVDNCAIYSALFLSFSIPMAMNLPDIYQFCDRRDEMEAACDMALPGRGRHRRCEWSEKTAGRGGFTFQFGYNEERSLLPCVVSRRVFYYIISCGIAAHILTILLAMAFINVLNEAARDADVYRLFAKGQGFRTTVKVQRTFQAGSLANIAAMVVVGDAYLGWDVVILWAALFCGIFWVYFPTASRLFTTGSIHQYWREELDANDPYDLTVPAAIFERRLKAAELIDAAVGGGSAAVGGGGIDAAMRGSPLAAPSQLGSTAVGGGGGGPSPGGRRAGCADEVDSRRTGRWWLRQ